MLFKIIFFNKTALHSAVQKGNQEIVKHLLEFQKTDVNIICIKIIFLIQFNNQYFLIPF